MKKLLKQILCYLNKPYIGFPLALFLFYCWNYIAAIDDRRIYKIAFNCAEVIKINDTSDYKTQPSIIVREESEYFEIYQLYSYNYDFKKFKLGDKVCKEANNFNFIRVKNEKSLDTVFDYGRELINRLLFIPSKLYDETKLNCDCL